MLEEDAGIVPEMPFRALPAGRVVPRKIFSSRRLLLVNDILARKLPPRL